MNDENDTTGSLNDDNAPADPNDVPAVSRPTDFSQVQQMAALTFTVLGRVVATPIIRPQPEENPTLWWLSWTTAWNSDYRRASDGTVQKQPQFLECSAQCVSLKQAQYYCDQMPKARQILLTSGRLVFREGFIPDTNDSTVSCMLVNRDGTPRMSSQGHQMTATRIRPTLHLGRPSGSIHLIGPYIERQAEAESTSDTGDGLAAVVTQSQE